MTCCVCTLNIMSNVYRTMIKLFQGKYYMVIPCNETELKQNMFFKKTIPQVYLSVVCLSNSDTK